MSTPVTKLTITKPDDWHLHLRGANVMRDILAHTTARFARALIMPNLIPPIINVEQAIDYRKQILGLLPPNANFDPMMTLYMTANTTIDEIQKAANSEFIAGIKLYPAGATTNSDQGIADTQKMYKVFEAIESSSLILEIHAESTDPQIDIFDREKHFIDHNLVAIVKDFPKMKIVLEHATTSFAIDFVLENENVAASITPHHLLLNRNDLFRGGIHPHHFCLPILKREHHRRALIKAAISANPKFFAGTDSAPHPIHAKQSACGCAGIYNSHAALELYAEVFEQNQSLDKLEGFCALFGAHFYNKPINTDTITLEKKSWTVPQSYALGADELVPLRAGAEIFWKVK